MAFQRKGPSPRFSASDLGCAHLETAPESEGASAPKNVFVEGRFALVLVRRCASHGNFFTPGSGMSQASQLPFLKCAANGYERRASGKGRLGMVLSVFHPRGNLAGHMSRMPMDWLPRQLLTGLRLR